MRQHYNLGLDKDADQSVNCLHADPDLCWLFRDHCNALTRMHISDQEFC